MPSSNTPWVQGWTPTPSMQQATQQHLAAWQQRLTTTTVWAHPMGTLGEIRSELNGILGDFAENLEQRRQQDIQHLVPSALVVALGKRARKSRTPMRACGVYEAVTSFVRYDSRTSLLESFQLTQRDKLAILDTAAAPDSPLSKRSSRSWKAAGSDRPTPTPWSLTMAETVTESHWPTSPGSPAPRR